MSKRTEATKPSPSAADKTIGHQVKQIRTLKNVSQEVLGNALGVSFQQVQKYEKGTNRISAARLKTIADFLEVPINHFWNEAFKDNPELYKVWEELPSATVRKQFIALMKSFGKLKP